MIDFNNAQKKLFELARSFASKLSYEYLPIDQARGRVLAKSIQSPCDLPGFDNSGMDGYALKIEESISIDPSEPKVYRIIGEASAGRPIQLNELQRDDCIAIMTGSRIPNRFNAVVKIEDTQCKGDLLYVYQSVNEGQNIRRRGEDIQTGQNLLNSGELLSPEAMMILAGTGIGQVAVYSKLQISILSTGVELVDDPNQPLSEGQIRNSSAPYLKAFFTRPYLTPTYLGSIPDQPSILHQILEREIEIENRDMIVVTGGVSAGKYDYLPKILNDLGVTILFHKVAQRPGKPILVGIKGRSVIFGLPGNPISTLLGSKFYVEAYIKTLLGLNFIPNWRATLTRDVNTLEHMHTFMKGEASQDQDGRLNVLPLMQQGSAMIGAMTQTNCWIIVPTGIDVLKAGSQVEIIFT